MTERPILFSAPMVRAILAGRKTQTRRVLKLPTKGEYVRQDMGGWAPTVNGGAGVYRLDRAGNKIAIPESVGIWNQTTGTCLDAPYQVGDTLWVREAWQSDTNVNHLPPRDIPENSPVWYPADDASRFTTEWSIRSIKTRPGMFMPRWASRIALSVTGVHIERLQDITEEDAQSEGVTHDFFGLWDSLNAERAPWASNPWVVAITFQPVTPDIEAGKAILRAANK